MPPIDLPPSDPLAALRLDRLRPAFVQGYQAPVCRLPETPEWPHGGEPDVRVVQGTSISTPSATPYVTVIHEPVLDSASNDLVKNIVISRTPTGYVWINCGWL